MKLPMNLQAPMAAPAMPAPELQPFVEACLACYRSCMELAMNCAERGGGPLGPDHCRTIADSAEMCRTAASFLLSGTADHRTSCSECAEICEECAERCAALEGLEHSVAECRRCAAKCREAAELTQKAA